MSSNELIISTPQSHTSIEKINPNTKNELHIYIIPPNIWHDRLNTAFGQTISETISIGFIRVNSNTPLINLRTEIEHQLDTENLPAEYVFCKSVGRSLAMVRQKQEETLKIKHFLPPNSESPEVYLLDAITAKRTQQSSSSTISKSPINNRTLGKLEDEDLERRILKDEMERRKRLEDELELRRRLEEENIRRLRSMEEEELERRRRRRQESEERRRMAPPALPPAPLALPPPAAPPNQNEQWRQELEHLAAQIESCKQDLSALEDAHRRKLAEFERQANLAQDDEEARRREWERQEALRNSRDQQILAQQKAELSRLEAELERRKRQLAAYEKQLEQERLDTENAARQKQQEVTQMQSQLDSATDASTADDPEAAAKLDELRKEMEEIEVKQQEMEQQAKKEREDAAEDLRRANEEFDKLKARWEQEQKDRVDSRAKREALERQMREQAEARRLAHEKRMQEERERMEEEKQKLLEQEKFWAEEKRKHEEELRKWEEAEGVLITDAENNRDQVGDFSVEDPDIDMSGLQESAEKKKLKAELKEMREQRTANEKQRDELIKKARNYHAKVHSKRHQTKEYWKKMYFDEKRKTNPLEEQLNKLKFEVETLNKKIIAYLESQTPVSHNKRVNQEYYAMGVMPPSERSNLIIRYTRLKNEIEELQRRIEISNLKLTAEQKLHQQVREELKQIREERTHKKIRLTKKRVDDQIVRGTQEFIYTPRQPDIMSQ